MLLLLVLMTIHYSRLNKQSRDGVLLRVLEGQPGFLYTL